MERLDKEMQRFEHPGTTADTADLDMDAYIIAKPHMFERSAGFLQRLGFRTHRVDPVEVKDSCNGQQAFDKAVQGCYLAHQSVWSKIQESGKSGFVLESDATTGGAPIEELKRRLSVAATETRASTTPRYISVGHCLGNMCTTAYFMNVKAAEIGSKAEFCSKKEPVDSLIGNTMCKRDHVRCTWEPGLPGFFNRCPGCFGEGLFVQDRKKFKGMHGAGSKQAHIQDWEVRETLLAEAGSHRTLNF
jgi:hypothetical protein